MFFGMPQREPQSPHLFGDTSSTTLAAEAHGVDGAEDAPTKADRRMHARPGTTERREVRSAGACRVTCRVGRW